MILSRQLLATIVENPTPGLDEAIDEFCKLYSVWRSYKGSCSDRKCRVCTGDGDKSDGDDDQEEDQDQEDKENEGDEGENGDEEEEEEEDEGEDGSMGDEKYVEDEVDEEEEGQHEDDGKKSSFYDTSVLYSYQKGYTWAGTTANELMAIWQGLPYVKHNNGQITLTQPYQRTLSREAASTHSRPPSVYVPYEPGQETGNLIIR